MTKIEKYCSYSITTRKSINYWRKSAVDPQNFKPYINICVDSPCCLTYIWFLFLVMAIDHHTGVELINTEAVHIWYRNTHLHICLCSHLLHHFQLWPLKRTGAPERLWWICQKQGVCVSKQHLYAHLTILHPVAELFYSFSQIYSFALCNPSPQTFRYIGTEVFIEKITHACWNAATQTHKRLRTVKRMSSSCSSYHTPAVTFHPGSVSQAGRALSVTNPLD